jgi:hypothetical protein
MIVRMRKETRPGPRLARRVDPNHPPFSSFLERDAVREKRDRSRRWTLIVSIGVHVAALIGLLFYSIFHVDELFGPSVEVKMFSPAKMNSGADHQQDADRAPR